MWLLNRTTTKAVDGMTPLEAAFGKKPDLKGVREWGEWVYVRIEGGTKLGGRVREGRWIGMDDQSKGAQIYWPDSKMVTVERNISCDNMSMNHFEEIETVALNQTSIINSPNIITPNTNDNPPAINIVVPNTNTEDSDGKASKRTQKPSKKVADLLGGKGEWSRYKNTSTLAPGLQKLSNDWTAETETTGTAETTEYKDEYVFLAEVSDSEALEPQNIKEAKARPDWHLWEEVIEEELKMLKEAGTWDIVNVPKDANVVGSKWVFRAKNDAAGNVVRYKGQLVAQGFTQVPGVNYFDMFALVAWLASIRTVLAFAAFKDYETGQINIKAAYLNGELTSDERIFIRQPPRYEEESKGKVLRLLKSLYGLKQAGRHWYQKLVDIMLKLGFSRCAGDEAVFYRRSNDNRVLIIVLVHVDNCTIVGKIKVLVERFKTDIAEFVDITDLGELHWILGIKVC